MNIDDHIELSGASIDVLHALFFRGLLESGDLPSKSGAAALVEIGLATTSKIAALGESDNLFTYLTPPGQSYAIKFLAETSFGSKKPDCSQAITINITLNAAPALEQLEAAKRSLEVIFKNKIRNELQPGGLLYKAKQ